MDAAGLEAVNGLKQLAQRASQTVEPGDAQATPGSGVVDELGEAGAVEALSGDDVGKHPDRTGLDEAGALSLGGSGRWWRRGRTVILGTNLPMTPMVGRRALPSVD